MEQGLRDDESLPLDRDAAIAALTGLAPLLGSLDTDAAYYADALPPTTGELAASAVDEWDDGDGEVNFVQALLLREVLIGRLEPRSFDGGIDLEQADVAQVIIRHGALRLGGSLRLHAMLMVLGDLHVGGRVMDIVRSSRLTVTGDLTCKTLRIGSPFWVAGNVDAEAVCFDPGGKLWVGGELRANVVVGSLGSEGVTNGQVTATHYSPVPEWEEDGRAALAKLERILVPEALVHSDLEGGYFFPEGLLTLVEIGKPYLR